MKRTKAQKLRRGVRRGLWCAFRNAYMGLTIAARTHGFLNLVFERRIEGRKKLQRSARAYTHTHRQNFVPQCGPCGLPAQLEGDWNKPFRLQNSCCLGISMNELRRPPHQLADAKNTPLSFDKETCINGTSCYDTEQALYM